jgi:hypothetical protein
MIEYRKEIVEEKEPTFGVAHQCVLSHCSMIFEQGKHFAWPGLFGTSPTQDL